jgi:hypothetical protein
VIKEKNMNLIQKSTLFIVALVCPLSASAGTVVCSGKVMALAYHVNNNLMIRLDSMNKEVFFCSPDSEWSVAGTPYVTGPNTCKTMYSTFLAAKMAGKSLYNVYFDGDQVPASCDAWGDWKHANIRYFRLAE